MSLGGKIVDAVNEKSHDLGEKIGKKYREYVGEELAKKEERLKKLEISLEQREKDVSRRESDISKYYRIPRAYIQIPLFVIFCAAAYFGYQAVRSEFGSFTSAVGADKVDSERARSATGRSTGSYSDCVSNGIEYYKEIGSYPTLSTGEDAKSKVEGMCWRSNGMAF